VRPKGERRFLLHGVIAGALCAVAGHALWWLTALAWRGDSTPYFIREPGASIAGVVAMSFVGYLQASRDWKRNEREYVALAEAVDDDSAVTRSNAI
jgi:hypothetical protein